MATLAGIPDKILKETEETQKIINDIKNSETYLIYSNKKSIISKIEDLQKEIETYSIRKVLKADFVSKTKDNLNECKKLILSYNLNFIQQRKKDYAQKTIADSLDSMETLENAFSSTLKTD